jgi:hypothetical protein
MFNAESFLSTAVTGEMATKIISVPEGVWNGQIVKLDTRQQDKKDGTGKMSMLDVTWEILDEEVKKKTALAKPTCRQTLFLDFNEQGALERGEGKNVALGKLREALGQNNKGKPWKPGDLMHQFAKVTVKHSPNDKDPESPFSNVVAVTKRG